MSYRTDETDITVIKLSQLEGRQLFSLLEHSIARADQGRDPCWLSSALESLGDANDLARWKRENVDLELRPEEIAAVLQALAPGHECCKQCSSLTAVLGGVSNRLRICLETQSTAAAGTAAFAATTQRESPCLSDSPAAAH